MIRKSGIIAILLLIFSLGFACNLGELFAPPTETPLPPTTTRTYTAVPSLLPTSTVTPTVKPTLGLTTLGFSTLTRTYTKAPTATVTRTRTAAPAASCEITALSNTPAFNRPSLVSDQFGIISTGMKLIALVKTADNWYGFDPGVAQAGNVGAFRYRWVHAANTLSISPVCANLKILDKVPLPGICYVMSMGTTPVRQTPNTTSTLVYTFTLGDYAQALAKSGTWIKINLAISNISGLSVPGWVSQDLVGLNGCSTPLPILSP